MNRIYNIAKDDEFKEYVAAIDSRLDKLNFNENDKVMWEIPMDTTPYTIKTYEEVND